MTQDAMTLRNYALTDEEARTVYVILGATIEQLAATATDGELVAAITLRDRFKPEGDTR